MNQRYISVARRSIALGCLLLGELVATALIAQGQPPAVIPNYAAGAPSPSAPPPSAAVPAGTVYPGSATLVDSAVNSAGPYYKVTGADDHLKMVVNSSRFLTLDKKIPQVQVNNPDILDVMPVSPRQVQISAKRTGVTQVNLWGEDKRIYTVTVVVMGDAAELSQILRELFPKTALTIVPVNGNSVIISGYVDQQEAVPKIVAVAGKYFPEVINNMIVSGVQQSILHVKVYEVSRTKLRNMGFDWAIANGNNGNLIMSGVSGLLTTVAPSSGNGGALGSMYAPDQSLKFTFGGANAFYGVLNALRQDGFGKLLSEPNLVAISGRPAHMRVGGQLGYMTGSAIGGQTGNFLPYGTELDFVPIVLGNGRMHIDIRTKISEPEASNGSGGVPGLIDREVETGVELRAGQTLAIAGLIEQRVEANNQGLPWISEIPYLGVPFRSVSHSTNEVEFLVLVTPEIVDGMQPCQVPACLPGTQTADPSDWELFFKGHLEVPNCCPDPAGCRNCAGGYSTGFNAGEGPAGYPLAGQQNPQNRSTSNQVAGNPQPPQSPEPGFIGPIGYDVLK